MHNIKPSPHCRFVESNRVQQVAETSNKLRSTCRKQHVEGDKLLILETCCLQHVAVNMLLVATGDLLLATCWMLLLLATCSHQHVEALFNLLMATCCWIQKLTSNKSPQQATTRPHGQLGGDLLLEPSTSCQKLNMFKSWQQVARTRFSTKKAFNLSPATGNLLNKPSTCCWQQATCCQKQATCWSNRQQVAHPFNLLPATSNLSPVNKLLSTSRQCGQGFMHSIKIFYKKIIPRS